MRKYKRYGIKLIEGSVKSLSSVTRNRVQIELKGDGSYYELFIDQSWVLNKNDHICLIVGKLDETGKVCCYGYRNYTKGVIGWKNESSVLMMMLEGIGLKNGNSVFIAILVGAGLCYFFPSVPKVSSSELVMVGVILVSFAVFMAKWFDREYNYLHRYKVIALSLNK